MNFFFSWNAFEFYCSKFTLDARSGCQTVRQRQRETEKERRRERRIASSSFASVNREKKVIYVRCTWHWAVLSKFVYDFLSSHVARCARCARIYIYNIHVWLLGLWVEAVPCTPYNGIHKYFVCAISKIANPSQHHYIDFSLRWMKIELSAITFHCWTTEMNF